MVQGGQLSYQSFYEALQSGEWVGHTRTHEDELALIDEESSLPRNTDGDDEEDDEDETQ